MIQGESNKEKVNRLFKRLEKIPEYIIILLMLIILFDLMAGVLSRYIGRHAFPWVEELGAFSLLWLVFVGSAVAIAKDFHFRIPVIIERRSINTQYIMSIVGLITILVFSLLMIVSGIKIVKFSSTTISQELPMSYMLPYSSMPIGGALMIIYAIIKFIKTSKDFLKRKKNLTK